MAYTIRHNNDNGITIYRAEKCDVNGNPRHIVHFLDFLTDEERDTLDVLQGHARAHEKIKKYGYGWRKYSCREFGGGFITQGDYCGGRETEAEVLNIRNCKYWHENA